MRVRLHILTAFLATLATTGAAQAASSASASVSNFNVSYTGSFEWVDSGITLGSGWAQDQTPVSLDMPYPAYPLSPAFADIYASERFATQSSSTTGRASSAAISSTANSLTVSVTTPDTGGVANASASWLGQFVLGKKSSVTFSWDTSVAGANTGGDFYRYLNSYGVSNAFASTSLLGGTLTQNTFMSGSSDYYYNLEPELGFIFSDSGSKKSLTVTNLSSTTGSRALNFNMSVQVSTTDYGNTPAVPEPEVWALGLAGLGMLGTLKRRRLAAVATR